jgi:hypothetical protein
MTAYTLQDAITQVQTIVSGVSGIRAAPNYPPENINDFPFAVAFPGDGEFDIEMGNLSDGIHNIVVELHVARKDLPRDVATAGAYIDSISLALWSKPTLSGRIRWFKKISYKFGPLGWGGADTLGIRFTIHGIELATSYTPS